MSTKAIREALSLARARKVFGDTEEEMRADDAAEKALQAIEKAAKVVAAQGIFEMPEGEDSKTQAAINEAEAVMVSIAEEAP